MKKKLIGILLFISISVIFFGCEDSDNIYGPNHNQIIGSGKIVTQTRNLSDCSGLILKNVGNIYLIQADSQSVLIEADDNIIDKVITVKENGSLLTGLPDGSYSGITLNIHVTLKSVDELIIEGAGNIYCGGQVHSDNLYCSINGAGNIRLKGYGDYLNCIINGAGNINAKEYTAAKCTAVVNGAGNCILYVTDRLDAIVNGVGSIVYYGNPANVNTSVTGVGQINIGR